VKKFTPIIILLLVFVLPITQVPRAYSAESTAKNKALSLIENVFPIDISQYNVTFTKYHETDLPSFLFNGFSSEVVTYTLESEESVFELLFSFENNAFSFCFVGMKNGSIISDRSYANLIEAADCFLEKYQNYNGENLAEMKRMLKYADETKNMTLISGNLTLTIRNSNTPFAGNHTSFRWRYTINGVNYPGIEVSFSDGAFYGLIDKRGAYAIGDTTVNISKEEAVSIAIDYAKNCYSYDMGGGVTISDFNVTESRAVAWLSTSPREPYVLYPLWDVMLYLDHRYPGSVYGILVGLWADSGNVSFCSNAAAATLYPDEQIIVDPYYGQEKPTALIIEVPAENPLENSAEKTGLTNSLDESTHQAGLDLTQILVAISIVSAILLGLLLFVRHRSARKNQTIRHDETSETL
jgi:hypothetical protein